MLILLNFLAENSSFFGVEPMRKMVETKREKENDWKKNRMDRSRSIDRVSSPKFLGPVGSVYRRVVSDLLDLFEMYPRLLQRIVGMHIAQQVAAFIERRT